MKIKFNQTVTTKEAVPQTFEKGETVDFAAVYAADPDMKALHGDKIEAAAQTRAAASAQHWLNRGLATDVTEKPAKNVAMAGRVKEPEKPAEPVKPADTAKK